MPRQQPEPPNDTEAKFREEQDRKFREQLERMRAKDPELYKLRLLQLEVILLDAEVCEETKRLEALGYPPKVLKRFSRAAAAQAQRRGNEAWLRRQLDGLGKDPA